MVEIINAYKFTFANWVRCFIMTNHIRTNVSQLNVYHICLLDFLPNLHLTTSRQMLLIHYLDNLLTSVLCLRKDIQLRKEFNHFKK